RLKHEVKNFENANIPRPSREFQETTDPPQCLGRCGSASRRITRRQSRGDHKRGCRLVAGIPGRQLHAGAPPSTLSGRHRQRGEGACIGRFRGRLPNQPAGVAKNLKPLAALGIAGINIEDGTDASALLAKKIEAIKKMASSLGVDIFVNARTDVYLQDLVPDENKVQE